MTWAGALALQGAVFAIFAIVFGVSLVDTRASDFVRRAAWITAAFAAASFIAAGYVAVVVG